MNAPHRNRTFRVAVGVVAAALGLIVCGCAPISADKSARDALSSVIDESISAFDEAGGSETTSAGGAQYALIYDPSAPSGRQVVTADLADPTSPAFGDLAEIAIHSMRALVDSEEFLAATVNQDDTTFDVTGSAFSAEFQTRDGLITRLTLDAGSNSSLSQTVLITYGVTPQARTIFDLAK